MINLFLETRNNERADLGARRPFSGRIGGVRLLGSLPFFCNPGAGPGRWVLAVRLGLAHPSAGGDLVRRGPAKIATDTPCAGLCQV